ARRAGRGRAALTAVAGILVIGSLGFAGISLTEGDGADSPEGAVEQLFDAIDDEDAIGVVEALEPSERRILMDALEQLQTEGERLGLTSSDLDLHDVAGVDLRVDGLELQTEELRDDVVAVEIVHGTIASSGDIDAFPLGPVVRGAMDRNDELEQLEGDDGGYAYEDGEFDLGMGIELDDEREDLAGGRLVAVRRDGGWHVSLLWSLAEGVRRDADDVDPLPPASEAIPARGASSAEDAVREAVRAATEVDVERLIELVDPDEGRVLHEYGPLLVDAADEASDGEPVGVDISELELASEPGPDGSVVVYPTALSLSWGDDDLTVTNTYRDGCSETTYEYSDDYLEEWGDDEYGPQATESYSSCSDDVFAPFGMLTTLTEPGSLRVVAVERDGAWYLQPARTVVESVLGPLRGLDRDQIEQASRMWSGEIWLSEPDEVWEACGVERPSLDTTVEESRDAFETCREQLPDDYEGPWGLWGGGFLWTDESDFEIVGEGIDDEAYPGVECYRSEFDDDAEGGDATPGERTLGCLQDLADSGEVEQVEVDRYRCSMAYQEAFGEGAFDLTDEEWEQLSAEAEEAFDACLADLDGG
ncbi:MAG: hypothetical protein KDA94_10140, partial [Acidimicrobiales bacterium]|nr:hypothetical protein [Acidimicrobiales bacterium]